jgi:hypothetical protein
MAFLYVNNSYTDINSIINILNDYNELEVNKRINPIVLSKSSIKIGNKDVSDFIEFSEYIHGQKNLYSSNSKGSSVEKDFVAEKKALWSGNNIDIYDGDDVGKCIAYTQGGLTGRGYSFCIGQPGNTMYKSYRDTKSSSFYFIVDKNKFKQNKDGTVNLDDPLHIVVYDVTSDGIELTDADNDTGNIAEFGMDASGYERYLKSMGVPVEKLKNRPKTEKEVKDDMLIGKQNTDFYWFRELPIEYKSAYIGRGHLLTNDQFDYLLGEK